ncbi:hypothetical protein ES705_17557 [subsurface metagenome]
MKYNNMGTKQWEKLIGGGDTYRGITIDSSDNVYVAGISKPPPNSYIRIRKFDSLGTQLWDKSFYGSENLVGMDIAVDSNDDVYVCHSYYQQSE